jgi:hypothetical protein
MKTTITTESLVEKGIHPMTTVIGYPGDYIFSWSAQKWCAVSEYDYHHLVSTRNFLIEMQINYAYLVDLEKARGVNHLITSSEQIARYIMNGLLTLHHEICNRERAMGWELTEEKRGKGLEIKWYYAYNPDVTSRIGKRTAYLKWLIAESERVNSHLEFIWQDSQLPKADAFEGVVKQRAKAS